MSRPRCCASSPASSLLPASLPAPRLAMTVAMRGAKYGVSAVFADALHAQTALFWALMVVAFGLGYIGGRLR